MAALFVLVNNEPPAMTDAAARTPLRCGSAFLMVASVRISGGKLDEVSPSKLCLTTKWYVIHVVDRMTIMRKSNVDGLALKDLRFLPDVLNGSGITRAGEVLGLSQPAASRLMDKIRAALGDPLLVRSRVGWTRTAFGDDLRPRLVEAVHSFESLAIGRWLIRLPRGDSSASPRPTMAQ